MEATRPDKGTLVLQTAVAMVLALVAYVVVATLAGMFLYFTQNLLTVIRPGVIAFFAVIIGSVVGMGAAKAACDAVLRGYHRRAVFMMFAVLILALVCFEILYVPISMNQITSFAQLISAAAAAYVCFWQDE